MADNNLVSVHSSASQNLQQFTGISFSIIKLLSTNGDYWIEMEANLSM